MVEAKLLGVGSIGLEANPSAHFASSVKVDWEISPNDLESHMQEIAGSVLQRLRAQGIDDDLPFDASQEEFPLKTLGPEAAELLITNSISPVPLHKSLVLLECIRQHHKARCYQHLLLAYAKALVFKISNLHFGPEVGAGKPKEDTPVVSAWLAEVERITSDLRLLAERKPCPSKVILADSRHLSEVVQPYSIDAIITSPPYPNEKDYTRTTRLESVILGFIKNKYDLRLLKKNLIRSNTRGVYKADNDDQWVAENREIQRISAQIEQRRIELGKDSGFERLYSRVTKLYFGGMARHFSALKTVLRPGAQLAYVVGDQASYLRVMIRTGDLLAEIATDLGYEVVRTDLFRTRFATASNNSYVKKWLSYVGQGRENIRMPANKNRYDKIVEAIFNKYF